MNTEFSNTQNAVEQAVQSAVQSAAQPVERKVEVKYRNGSSEAVYGLGMIGAWIFYIGRAKTFQEGVVGFLKGLVWPVLVVYKALVLLEGEPGKNT